MLILGIDPGTAEMGWGIIQKQKAPTPSGRDSDRSVGAKIKSQKARVKYVDHGMIKTSSATPLPQRLLLIKNAVEKLIADQKIDEVAIERVVFNVNKRSAISVAQAYGMVMLTAAEADIPVYEYNALEAKLLLTGSGRADKKVVQQGVKKRLRLKKHPTPNHSADALAIALCHVIKNHAA